MLCELAETTNMVQSNEVFEMADRTGHFKVEHWKMQRKNWAFGQRKSITRGIGNWMQEDR